MTVRAASGVLAVVAAIAFAGIAGAVSSTGSDLHDARYCEILELKGAPPDAQVKVWNTIGLNNCPAAKWEAFDRGSWPRSSVTRR